MTEYRFVLRGACASRAMNRRTCCASVFLLATFLLLFTCPGFVFGDTEESVPKILVTTLQPYRSSHSINQVHAIGNLDSKTHRIEKTRSSGRLTKFFVKPGDVVEPGMELFEVENEQEGYHYLPYRQCAMDKGVVAQQLVSQGSSLIIGEKVLELYDSSKMRAKLRLSQNSFGKVFVGQGVLLHSDAGNFYAQVSEIDRVIDARTLSFFCWADLMIDEKQLPHCLGVKKKVFEDNCLFGEALLGLPIGLSVRATFSAKAEETVSKKYLAPEEAVYFHEGKTFLFAIDSNSDKPLREGDLVQLKRFEVNVESIHLGQMLVQFIEPSMSINSFDSGSSIHHSSEPVSVVLRGHSFLGHQRVSEAKILSSTLKSVMQHTGE